MTTSVNPPAIRVRALSKSFIERRGLEEVLLSVPLIARVCQKSNWLSERLVYKEVLKDIDFEIPVGSIFGLFGVNGAGKSTLVSCLANILSPDTGNVEIHGKTVEQLGVAFGQTVAKCSRGEMFSEFTALANIEFVARLYSVNVEQAIAAARTIFDLLGLKKEDQEKQYCGRLSVGSKGKVALVCSLVPLLPKISDGEAKPILLLDEPTIGFDVRSVQRFFEALEAIRCLIPQLTIVIATNDPREAALVDDYVAIAEGTTAHDLEKLTRLKAAMVQFREAIECFSDLLDHGDQNGKIVPREILLPKVEFAPRDTAPSALQWRGWKEIRQHKLLSIGVVMMLVIPNLIGFAAASESKGLWPAFAMTAMGILVTLMVRESQRLLERERSYYCTLETLLMAPISRWTHFFTSLKFSWGHQMVNTIAAMIVLGLLTDPRVAVSLFKSLASCSVSDLCGLGLLLAGVMLATQGLGLLTSLSSFVMRPTMTWLVVSIVPTMVLMCSGIYNHPSSLPWLFKYMAYINPLTYGASAMQGLLDIGADYQLPLCRVLQSNCPSLSDPWANLICCMTLVAIYFVVAAWLYISGIKLLRKIGRLRNTSLA